MIVFLFSMHGEVIIEDTNGNCHFCTLKLACRPLCNIGIHLTRDL